MGNDGINSIDFLGLATQAQYKHVLKQALHAWRQNGNRTQLGRSGEVILERMLEKSGHIIIKGPATSPSAHNADIVAFDPNSGKVLIIDNKIQTTKASVSRANAVTTDIGRQKSINNALDHLDELNLKPSDFNKIFDALKNDNIDWIVSDASPKEVHNMVSRLSERLRVRGVKLGQVIDGKFVVQPCDEVLEQAVKRTGSRLAKCVPGIGAVAAAGLNAPRLHAANNEDLIYDAQIKALGGTPIYSGASLERELTIIAGEEVFSEGGAAIGLALGATGGPWGMMAGTIIGGYVGDMVGGWGAAKVYDSNDSLMQSTINYEEYPQIKLIPDGVPGELYWNPKFIVPQ